MGGQLQLALIHALVILLAVVLHSLLLLLLLLPLLPLQRSLLPKPNLLLPAKVVRVHARVKAALAAEKAKLVAPAQVAAALVQVEKAKVVATVPANLVATKLFCPTDVIAKTEVLKGFGFFMPLCPLACGSPTALLSLTMDLSTSLVVGPALKGVDATTHLKKGFDPLGQTLFLENERCATA